MRGTALRFFTAIPPAGPLLPMSAERRVALVLQELLPLVQSDQRHSAAFVSELAFVLALSSVAVCSGGRLW
jgi:hypothetical protein